MLYKKNIDYLIKIIEEIGFLLENNNINDKYFLIKLSKIIFNIKYRIHFGIFIIFISLILYIIDII
jgi:hypothetical protein